MISSGVPVTQIHFMVSRYRVLGSHALAITRSMSASCYPRLVDHLGLKRLDPVSVIGLTIEYALYE